VRLLYAEDNASDADLTRHYFATHASDIQLDVVNHGEACVARRDDVGRPQSVLDARFAKFSAQIDF
jgi:hypothetical protein